MAADATIALKEPILQAIKQVTGRDYLRIEMFNDHPLTSHPLVVNVLHQARGNVISGAVDQSRGRSAGPAPTWWSYSLKPLTRVRRLFA